MVFIQQVLSGNRIRSFEVERAPSAISVHRVDAGGLHLCCCRSKNRALRWRGRQIDSVFFNGPVTKSLKDRKIDLKNQVTPLKEATAPFRSDQQPIKHQRRLFFHHFMQLSSQPLKSASQVNHQAVNSETQTQSTCFISFSTLPLTNMDVENPLALETTSLPWGLSHPHPC